MKLIYLFLIITAAVFYPMYNDNLSYLLFIAVLLLPLALLVILFFIRRNTSVKVRCETEMPQRETPVKIKIRIVNKSVFPISVCSVLLKYRMLGLDGGKKFQKYKTNIPVGSRSVENLIIDLKPEHCGAVECSVAKIYFKDFIGLFSLYKKIDWNEIIPVIPAVYPFETTIVSNMNADMESDVFSQTKSGDDPSEVYALREYRDGDSMNRIHHKLSSRGDDIIVKELSEPVSGKILLVPNVSSCKTDKDADAVLDIFASLAYFLTKKNLPFSAVLCGNAFETKRLANKEELYAFLAEQTRLLHKNQRDESVLLDYFSEESNRFNAYSHVVFISAELNVPVLKEIEHLCESERNSVICIGQDNKTEETHELSETVVYYTSAETFVEDLTEFCL